MAINFIPYDELFAPEYQLIYISKYGNIVVGPYTYNVFHKYTVPERQKAFQDCKKYLPWEFSEEQEHWELCMYMYQFIIKSPPPFPYEEYPLSEEIIMSATWNINFSIIDVDTGDVNVSATRTEEVTSHVQTFSLTGKVKTASQKSGMLEALWDQHLQRDAYEVKVEELCGGLAEQGRALLEARE